MCLSRIVLSLYPCYRLAALKSNVHESGEHEQHAAVLWSCLHSHTIQVWYCLEMLVAKHDFYPEIKLLFRQRCERLSQMKYQTSRVVFFVTIVKTKIFSFISNLTDELSHIFKNGRLQARLMILKISLQYKCCMEEAS